MRSLSPNIIIKIALLSEVYTYYTMMKQKMSTENHRKSIDIFPKATLADIDVARTCVIVECHLPTKVKARVADMGLVPHTEVAVLRIAPLGDPIVIRARGYELCLRKDTAMQFDVRPL